MAARSLTVAALRSRPRQAVLVAVLSAVVTAAAALGPLYARAVEQSVLRHVVAGAGPAQSLLVVTDESDPITSPQRLAEAVRTALPEEFGTPVGGADAPVRTGTTGLRLTSRDDVCAHVRIVNGRCPQAAGEALVSRRTGTALEVVVGGSLPLSSGTVRVPVTVVGLYEGLDPTDAYWGGRPTTTSDARGGSIADDVLTPWATLESAAWPELKAHLDVPLRPERVDLRRVDAIRAATVAAGARAQEAGGFVTTGIPALLESSQDQRRQSRDVILLLTVQLAVLGLVVLAFVGAAVTEQRRPELALARLRGHGTAGAGGMLLREVGLLLLAGAVAGTLLALLVGRIATWLWLENGVSLELRSTVMAAVVAALAAGLIGIGASAYPTLRRPLTSLLRRVPARASSLRIGAVEGAVGAAAAAGVVTLLAGERGAVALLAPGLLAVAGGLLLAQLVVPVAAPLARRALRRGRVPTALASVHVARSPALRRLIAIVTVACALLVFAVDAWTVAAANRTTRAEVEAGAAVILRVDAPGATALRQAVLEIDPNGEYATPVVLARSATEGGPRTAAVEPEAFRRIALWGRDANRPTAEQLSALVSRTVAPVPLPAGTTALSVTARFAVRALDDPGREAELEPISLVVLLARPTGDVERVRLGRLRFGRATYGSAVRCPDCTLAGFVVERTFGDSYEVSLSVALEIVEARTAADRQPLDLGPTIAVAWQVAPGAASPTTATVRPGPPLTIVDPTSYQSAEVRRGVTPAIPPALVAGNVPSPLRTNETDEADFALAPNLAGIEHLYEVQAFVPLVPGTGSRTVLTDLSALAPTAVAGSAQTSYDVWLAKDDPARERALVGQLADRGLRVLSRDSARDHEREFAREGPTLALRLALLAGAIALLLAAAVLVVGVATAGTGRARDLAGLRVVGVPLSTLHRGCVREHVTVAVLGVLAGSALGLVAAQAALPDVPLFASPSAQLPIVLTPAWSVVAVTVVGCLLLLCGVAYAVGRALARSAHPARLREAA